MYATPLYENVGMKNGKPHPLHLQYASTILACLAVVVTMPIYIFYWKGPTIREKSKFAQTLAADRKASMATMSGGGANRKTEEKELQGEA